MYGSSHVRREGEDQLRGMRFCSCFVVNALFFLYCSTDFVNALAAWLFMRCWWVYLCEWYFLLIFCWFTYLLICFTGCPRREGNWSHHHPSSADEYCEYSSREIIIISSVFPYKFFPTDFHRRKIKRCLFYIGVLVKARGSAICCSLVRTVLSFADGLCHGLP